MNPLFMQRLELLCLLLLPLLAGASPSPGVPLNRRQSPDNTVLINSADSYWYAMGLIPSLNTFIDQLFLLQHDYAQVIPYFSLAFIFQGADYDQRCVVAGMLIRTSGTVKQLEACKAIALHLHGPLLIKDYCLQISGAMWSIKVD